MKKFAYIQHHGLPSQKAHSVYITKVAQAASTLAYDSYLVFPSYNLGSEKEIKNTYALQEGMPFLKKIKTPDLRTYKIIPKNVAEHVWYIFSSWIFAIKVYVWLRQEQIDVIQTGDREIILLCKLYGKPNNLKIIYDVHFDFSSTAYDNWMEKRVLSTIDRFVVNCEYLKTKFIKNLIYEEKILVLPNGFDPALYNRLTQNESRKKYQFPKDKFIVGFLGRFETHGIEKGIRELLQAAAQLKNDIPICIVAIGGPTKLVAEYQTLASELGLKTDEAIIRDYVSQQEVGDILAGFDVGSLLYPPVDYYVEKMSPMKAVEYQAAHLPILATNIPSISNVLGNNAVYLKAFTVESIVEAIKHMYKNRHNSIDAKMKPLTWEQRQKIILQNI